MAKIEIDFTKSSYWGDCDNCGRRAFLRPCAIGGGFDDYEIWHDEYMFCDECHPYSDDDDGDPG